MLKKHPHQLCDVTAFTSSKVVKASSTSQVTASSFTVKALPIASWVTRPSFEVAKPRRAVASATTEA